LEEASVVLFFGQLDLFFETSVVVPQLNYPRVNTADCSIPYLVLYFGGNEGESGKCCIAEAVLRRRSVLITGAKSEAYLSETASFVEL
jgi:hypothetical protein